MLSVNIGLDGFSPNELVRATIANGNPSPGSTADYCNDVPFFEAARENKKIITTDLLSKLNKTGRVPLAGDVKYIFHTRSGSGPTRQPTGESLLDPLTGNPMPAGSAGVRRHKRMQIRMGENGGLKNHNSDFRMLRCPFTWGLLTAAFAIGAIVGIVVSKKSNR